MGSRSLTEKKGSRGEVLFGRDGHNTVNTTPLSDSELSIGRFRLPSALANGCAARCEGGLGLTIVAERYYLMDVTVCACHSGYISDTCIAQVAQGLEMLGFVAREKRRVRAKAWAACTTG